MKKDSLSAMLEAVRIRGSVYYWSSFGPPWGVAVPQFERVVRSHIVLRGHCCVDHRPVRADDQVEVPRSASTARRRWVREGGPHAEISARRMSARARSAPTGSRVIPAGDPYRT
jgi:hypothetical protein